jgi:hypothetical protein
MSHSTKLEQRIGRLTLANAELKLGSTSQVNVSSCPAPTALGAAVTTVTAAQAYTGLIVQTPSAAQALQLPTAATLIAANNDIVTAVGDCFDVTIVNLSGANAITVEAATGGSVIGSATVAVSTSATYRIRFTNIGTPAYVAYRMC